jgi:hypothetical protein
MYLTGGTMNRTSGSGDTLSNSGTTAMGPGTQDCNTSGGNCSYTANTTSAPPNAVALGAGTIDRLKVNVGSSVGNNTSNNYTFMACVSTESAAAPPTFVTTCTANLSCVIQGSTTLGTRQTSGFSCADTSGSVAMPAVGSNGAILFWLEAVASGNPNAVQATWSARFVGQSTNQ